MFRRQRQAHQRTNRPLGTQQRVRQLEQHIRPRGQALIKFPTKQPKVTQTGHSGALTTVGHTRQTLHHGHRYLRASWIRNLKMINAVAAQCHTDTPPTINQHHPAEPHTLKIKLKQLRSAKVISAGHAFVQNLRRGHYELGSDFDPRHRLPTAFAELIFAIEIESHAGQPRPLLSTQQNPQKSRRHVVTSR
jgi:hypothetical protein